MSLLTQYLDLDGDGTGTTNAVGDYTTPDDFYLEVQTDAPSPILDIYTLLVTIKDATGFTAEKYGDLTALTNGITLDHKDGAAVIHDFTPVAIKTNGDWLSYVYDSKVILWGAANDILTVKWDFTEKTGRPLRLIEGESLVATLSDNMTGLITQTFLARGHYV